MRMTVILALATLLTAAAAHADNVEDARRRYKHATTAFALGKYAEAAADYEAAYELAPDAALLFNAAQSHRLAGNLQRALVLYRSYLRMYGAGAENHDEVERRIAELKQAIDAQASQKPAASPPSSSAPAGSSSAVVAAPASNAVEAAPPPRHKRSPWVWVGVAGAVVVVAGIGIGLGVGLGGKADPKPTIGAVTY